MTLSIVPTDSSGINNLAEGLSGFLDPAEEALQETMMTTLFIGGACPESNGRASYLLMDDGSKMWVPNSLRCWLVDLKIVEQRYESFDPIDKLLIRVTAVDGSSYIYRTSLNSWTATSFLQNFRHMTRKQLSDQVTITLVPKGRATFVNVMYCEGGAFHRVEIPKSEFGSGKMGYDAMLDAISYTNGTAQDNDDSALIEAQVSTEEEPFDPGEDLDELIDEIKSTKLPARRKRSSVAEALSTNV
ncbi:hypothetical protein [Synechococcus sp. UW179B]|jgi:hypothetical protein|uniref:hypothetical protein n=1 Tax=Synechococcus sp. UW179B TaxID=2575516 RepID=UPI000E0F8C38|nr:hypothetical protein [Synechococcus sp. UW179B]